MPTLNERIAAIDAAMDKLSKARKLAEFYRKATATPPTLLPSWADDPDAAFTPTPEMKQTLATNAFALLDAAAAEIVKARG